MKDHIKLINFVLIHHGIGFTTRSLLCTVVNQVLLIVTLASICFYLYILWYLPIEFALKAAGTVILAANSICLIRFLFQRATLKIILTRSNIIDELISSEVRKNIRKS